MNKLLITLTISIFCCLAVPYFLFRFNYQSNVFDYIYLVGDLSYVDRSLSNNFYNIKLLNKHNFLLSQANLFLVLFFIIPFIAVYGKGHTARIRNNNKDSSWATKKEIKKKAKLFVKKTKTPKGIIIGSMNQPKKKYFWWGNYSTKLKPLMVQEPLSVLVLAPPGTGKTAGVVIPTLLYSYNSFIVLDIKGEIAIGTSRFRSLIGEVLNLCPSKPEISVRWNPFAKSAIPKEPRDIFSYVQQVSGVLIQGDKGKDKDYFVTAAKDLLTTLIFGDILVNGESSIPYLFTKFAKTKTDEETSTLPQAFLRDTLIQVEEKLKQDSKLHNVDNFIVDAKANIEMAENQFSGVYGTLKTNLSAFQDERMLEIMSDNEIDFLDFKKGTKTLYISVRDNEVDRLSGFIRLFFESMIFTFTSSKACEEDNIVSLMIDEFPRLGKMMAVMQAPALTRGQRLNVVLIAQDYAQIENLYGKETVQELESTTAYKVILPQNNYENAKRISDSLGTVKRLSYTRNTDKRSRDYSYSEKDEALMTPNEIMDLPLLDKLIIKWQFGGLNPIIAYVPAWFKYHDLIKRFGGIDWQKKDKKDNTKKQKNKSNYDEWIEEILSDDELFSDYSENNK